MDILNVYAEIPPVAQMTGYEMKTTFWGDFRVCQLDKEAIKETFDNAFREWKDDKIYGTELALVLNWLCWFYYEANELEVSRLYDKLWREIDCYICEHWKGENASYYYRTTD